MQSENLQTNLLPNVNSIDDVFKFIGNNGRYQIYLCCLVSYTGLTLGFSSGIILFTQPNLKFTCLDGYSDSESEASLQNQLGIPQNLTLDNQCFSPNSEIPGSTSTKTCQNFLFDNSTYTSTLTEEFTLICSNYKLFMHTFSISIYYLGYAFGGLFGGFLSDTYGRRRAILVCTCISQLCYYLTIFVSGQSDDPTTVNLNLWIYVMLRFVSGLFGLAGYITCFTYAVEIFPNKFRSYDGLLIGNLWALASVVLAIFAYWFRNWRDLTVKGMYLCLPSLLYLWLDESPIYCFSKGNFKQASQIFHRFAVKNGKYQNQKYETSKNSSGSHQIYQMLKTLDEYDKKSSQNKKLQKRTMLDLFRNGQNMKLVTLKLAVIWFTVGANYYGLYLNAGDLPYSTYLIIAAYGISDILSKIFTGKMINLKSVGRVKLLIVSLMVAGFCCFVSGILNGLIKQSASHDNSQLTSNATSVTGSEFLDSNFDLSDSKYKLIVLIFSILGRFAISATYGVMYVHTAEMYPTLIRSNGVSFGVSTSTIANMLSKFILMLALIKFWLPDAIFLLMCDLSCYLAGNLIETNGIPIINSFEEMELFYQSKM